MAEYSIQKAGDKNRKGQCYYLSKSRREERRILDPGHWLRGERFVLIIDEFPYLMWSNPAIAGLFQKAGDEYWSTGKVFLILHGSGMAMMENEVLG